MVADLYVVPGSFMVKVPEDLPSEIAVLTEMMAVTVGLDRAKQISAFPSESFRFDDSVVVIGNRSARNVLRDEGTHAGGGNDHCRRSFGLSSELREKLGADHVINASQLPEGDRLSMVRELTHGRGADVVAECAGVPQAVPESLEMLRIRRPVGGSGQFL